jgi:hypothetical protein
VVAAAVPEAQVICTGALATAGPTETMPVSVSVEPGGMTGGEELSLPPQADRITVDRSASDGHARVRVDMDSSGY